MVLVLSFCFTLRIFPNTSIFCQAVQYAHSFSMQSFESREKLAEMKKEFSALQKIHKRDQLKMKKLEDQAEAATKAQQIALQKVEAAEDIRKVAEAEKKEAKVKRAQAEKELREALATKKAEIDAAYTEGMADVAEDYKRQVKQACNKGYSLGWNALAKKLDLPVDSPWRKTKAMRLPCPLSPSPSQAEEEDSEAEAEEEGEGEEEALVRKAKSPPKDDQFLDLTQEEDEEVPKEANTGVLSSDLLLAEKTVEKTLAEIDAEVTADKETEVVVEEDAEVVKQKDAEVVLPKPPEVSTQPSAQVEEV